MRRLLSAVAVAACLSLVYVQQRVDLVRVGYQVERLRHVRDDLLDQHRVLHYNVLTLQSPVILSRRLARSDVQMTPPRHIEVVVPRMGSSPVPPSGQGPLTSQVGWLRQVRRLSVQWLEGGRPAEAEPVF